MLKLNSKQTSHLRALGHNLNPVVMIGNNGLSEQVLREIDVSLKAHELIKIKVLDTADVERHDAATELAGKTGSEVAQVLGNTILLYRPDPEEPRIALP